MSGEEKDVPDEPKIDWTMIRGKSTEFPPEAFDFVRRGLAHTVAIIHGGQEGNAAHEESIAASDFSDDAETAGDDVSEASATSPLSGAAEPTSRHVSGRELCMGLRDYAIAQYGRLALTVLRRWNIHRTEDFGKIVFAMVDAGLMRTSEEDTIEDFQGVFDFDEAFEGVFTR